MIHTGMLEKPENSNTHQNKLDASDASLTPAEFTRDQLSAASLTPANFTSDQQGDELNLNQARSMLSDLRTRMRDEDSRAINAGKVPVTDDRLLEKERNLLAVIKEMEAVEVKDEAEEHSNGPGMDYYNS
jgi:hypothetical protein